MSSAAFVKDEFVSDGVGLLSIASGENNFDVIISPTATLAEVRDAINDQEDNKSVIATIITDDLGQHLVLSAKKTGIDNKVTVTVDAANTGLSRLAYQPNNTLPNFATNLTQVTEAKNASITIDGTLVVTSNTNTFTNVIDGIDITAKKIHDTDGVGDDDDISQISISEDNSNVAKGLTAFVESYNELFKLSNNLGRSSKDGVGPLAGDSLLRGLMGKLRTLLSTPQDSGGGNKLTLSDLGVSVDQYGVYSIDSAKLNKSIDDDAEGVQQFLIGTDSKPGLATGIEKLTNFYTQSGGLLASRVSSDEDKLKDIDDERVSFTRKIAALEGRLLAQYNAMDLLVANLTSTGSYIQAQLSNMPGVVRRSNN